MNKHGFIRFENAFAFSISVGVFGFFDSIVYRSTT